MPVSLMKQILSVEEYYKWQSYLKFKQPDATELQLATITAAIIAAVGGKNIKAEDYLVSKVTAPKTDIATEDRVRGAFSALSIKKMG
jgi:predicted ribosome quality control (RQC) complex YloA/Tae2 family protein